MAINTIQVTFNPDTVALDIVTTSGNAAGTTWYVGIDGPAGTIKVLDTGTPDAAGTGISISIPDISAAILDGEYTIQIRIVDPGGYTENQLTTFTLAQTGEINYQITHTEQAITFVDATIYPNQTGDPAYTRTSLVTKPVPAAGVTAATTTFTGSQATLAMVLGDGKIYENVNWSISGSGSGQFSETSAFPVGYSGTWEFIYDRAYTGGANHFVVITTDPCGFINCLDEVWQSLVTSGQVQGGLRALDTYKSEQVALMLGHTAMYNYWKACGDITQAQYYYEQLSSLGECELTTTPRAVTGQTTPAIWTNVPGASYQNGFSEDVTDPFQYLVVGNQIFFRGVVVAANQDEAGLDMVNAAYWSTQGITFYDDCWITCIDNGALLSKPDLYYGKIVGGTIKIYSFAGNTATRGFGIATNLPIV